MNKLLEKSKLFLKRNSSTILTCLGAAGVVATAVTAVKATPKAMSLLREAEDDKKEKLTISEKICVAGPAYIPSIAIGASTIACIFGANVLNKRQQATLTSAYALLDNTYKEYRNKVKELYGVEGHNNVTKSIARTNFDEEGISEYHKRQEFFDFFSLSLFESSIERIDEAEKLINDTLNLRGYVTLAEFYEAIGVPCGEMDYHLGWSKSAGHIHGYKRVEFVLEKLIEEGGVVRYVLTMPVEPTDDFMN